MNCADLKNDNIMYNLFTSEDETIALNFINAFLFPENNNAIVKIVGSKSFYNLVLTKGAHSNYMTLNVFDEKNNKFYVEFHILSLHYGIQNITLEKNSEFDLKLTNENTASDYPVYFIFFTTFDIINIDNYFLQYSYKQKYSKHNVDIIIVSLPMFDKNIEQLTTNIDFWIYAFKHTPEKLKNNNNFIVANQLIEFLDFNKWTDEDKVLYSNAEDEYKESLLRILNIHKERNVLPSDYPPVIKENKAVFVFSLITKYLGVYPFSDFMVDNIDISSVDEVIRSISFILFREWRKGYMEAENVTEFNIVDELKLVDITKKCLKEAIYSFFTDDDYLKKGLYGDWYYFTLNLKLAIKLEYEYYTHFIVRTSDDYKTFIALMQISNYFDDEISRKLQINSDYKTAMEKNVNVDGLDLHISGTEERRKALLYREGIKSDNDFVRHIIEKLIIEYMIKIIHSKDMSYIKNYKDTIAPEYIDKLLQTNIHLFDNK
jgi:hypothetical protein